MVIVNITPEQAKTLAIFSQQRDDATRKFSEALTLLSLGHVAEGSRLTGIDIEYGTLMFETQPINDG